MLKKTKIIALLLCLGLGLGLALALGWFVYFSQDTMLRLDGLGDTLYIAQESKADEVRVSGASLEVSGIPDGESFLLKTIEATVLRLAPQGGTLKFSFSSPGFQTYLREWVEESSVSINHILGRLKPEGFYRLDVGGKKFNIYQANLEGKITFDRTGQGISETFSLEGCKYQPSGNFLSKNLLFGQDVRAINSFRYTASSIPNGTSIKVQFSQDKVNWYSSQGIKDAWESLLEGTQTLDLSALGWSGANFYYKAELKSDDCSKTPILDEVAVVFTTIK